MQAHRAALYLGLWVLPGFRARRWKRRSALQTCRDMAQSHVAGPFVAFGFCLLLGFWGAQMDKAQRAADMLSGALALLSEDADSAQARERLGLPPGDNAFGEEEPGATVQRAMQQARSLQPAPRFLNITCRYFLRECIGGLACHPRLARASAVPSCSATCSRHKIMQPQSSGMSMRTGTP